MRLGSLVHFGSVRGASEIPEDFKSDADSYVLLATFVSVRRSVSKRQRRRNFKSPAEGQSASRERYDQRSRQADGRVTQWTLTADPKTARASRHASTVPAT